MVFLISFTLTGWAFRSPGKSIPQQALPRHDEPAAGADVDGFGAAVPDGPAHRCIRAVMWINPLTYFDVAAAKPVHPGACRSAIARRHDESGWSPPHSDYASAGLAACWPTHEAPQRRMKLLGHRALHVLGRMHGARQPGFPFTDRSPVRADLETGQPFDRRRSTATSGSPISSYTTCTGPCPRDEPPMRERAASRRRRPRREACLLLGGPGARHARRWPNTPARYHAPTRRRWHFLTGPIATRSTSLAHDAFMLEQRGWPYWSQHALGAGGRAVANPRLLPTSDDDPSAQVAARHQADPGRAIMIDTRSARRQCHAQRHRGRAAGVGLHPDPPRSIASIGGSCCRRFATSCVFLVCYLVYHFNVGSVRFPGRAPSGLSTSPSWRRTPCWPLQFRLWRSSR